MQVPDLICKSNLWQASILDRPAIDVLASCDGDLRIKSNNSIAYIFLDGDLRIKSNNFIAYIFLPIYSITILRP